MTNLWSKQVLPEGRFLVGDQPKDLRKSDLLDLASKFNANRHPPVTATPIVRDAEPRWGGRLLRLEYREGLGLWGIFKLNDRLAEHVEANPTLGVHALLDTEPLKVVVGVDPAPIAGLSPWKRVEETQMFDNNNKATLSATQRQMILGRVASKLATLRDEASPSNDALLVKLLQLISGTTAQQDTEKDVALSAGGSWFKVRDFSGAGTASYSAQAVSRMQSYVAARTGLNMTGESDAQIVQVASELCEQGSPEQRLQNWADATGDGSDISGHASQDDVRTWVDNNVF